MRAPLAIAFLKDKPFAPAIAGKNSAPTVAAELLVDFAHQVDVVDLTKSHVKAVAEAALTERRMLRVPVLDGGLFAAVFAQDPPTMGVEVAGDSFTYSCRAGCFYRRPGQHPNFEVPYYWEKHEQSPVLLGGLRIAALRLAGLRGDSATSDTESSLLALAKRRADAGGDPDPELAVALAGYVYAGKAGERETKWFATSIGKIAGPDGAGEAWARAIAAHPKADNYHWSLNAALDAVSKAPPKNPALLEGVARECALRSAKAPNEACVDVGLEVGPAWRAALESLGPSSKGAQALLAEDTRVSGQSWADVIALWRSAPPSSMKGRKATTSPFVHAREGKNNRVMKRGIASILAAGDAPVGEVFALYERSGSWAVVRASAQVLAQRDPARLAERASAEISTLIPLTVRVLQKTSLDMDTYHLRGRRVADALLQLDKHGLIKEHPTPFLLSLSIPDPNFSRYASSVLRRNLSKDEFADGLFQFLAQRPSFSVPEVDAYKTALTSFPGVGPAIVRNLDGLLAEANGQPARVGWVHKLIGLSALSEVGEPAAKATLSKYASDPQIYILREGSKRRGAARGMSKTTELKFSDLANKAIEAIDGRSDRGS